LKITGIRTQLYQYETSRKLGDVNFPAGQKEWSGLAVFIDTDEGLTGVSIGSPASRETLHSMEPLLIGKDPRGVRGIWKDLVDHVFKGGNRGVASEAIAWLDVALWDLKAKINNEPLWRTLGASSSRVKAYASDIGLCLSDEELRQFYEEMAALGISAGKLKVGLDLESDMRRLGIMQEALKKASPNPLLMIDSNEYWSAKQAIINIREIEKHYPLFWAEEPAGRWDYRGLKKVSDNITAAVASGENLKDIAEFLPLLDHGAVDIVEIGNYTTGITGAMLVADFVYGYSLPVCVMNTPENVMAHLAAALPNHMMIEIVEAGRDVCFSVDTKIEDGCVVLGETPGLGLQFDEEKLQELAVAKTSTKTFIMPGRRQGAGLYIVPPE
jgi:L-alanine-DL-glutamate epimerase-like enolase superfamily enzyme